MARRINRRRVHSLRVKTDEAVTAPAYIKRQIPYLEYLSEEGLEAIKCQVDWLLENIGIEFWDDATALKIWRDAGATVLDTRVHAPTDLTRSLCGMAPSEFTQIARNSTCSVCIGGQNQVFVTVYGSAFVIDIDNGRRYDTIEDYTNLVKLVQGLPNLHHSGFLMCKPCDVPVSKRHLDMAYAHLRYSDKPHLVTIREPSREQDSIEIARIVHGSVIDDHCGNIGNLATNSPLLSDKVVTKTTRVYCEAGQGKILLMFILSGVMGTATTAASVAQGFAEVMMCIAFVQLVKPGAPIVFAHFQSSMSLRSGTPTFSMLEPVISHYITGQLARRLGLPLPFGGALTSSKIGDAQAVCESTDSRQSTAIAGANFVLHSAGWLEDGGYEKLICDAEPFGSFQKVLEGISFDENAMTRDAYNEVNPGEHFLGCAHTMRNYKTVFYEAPLSACEPLKTWEEKGSKTMEERAFERWKKALKKYETPPWMRRLSNRWMISWRDVNKNFGMPLCVAQKVCTYLSSKPMTARPCLFSK